MNKEIQEATWTQFGASIDMLRNAINMCPAENWNTESNFWYIAYHTLFWLDYYLTLNPEEFEPPVPFTLSEFESNGEMPERCYTKQELIGYLEFGRRKCHDLIYSLSDSKASSHYINPTKNYSVYEIILYNLRHVQHHAAQLNLLLRQEIDNAPKWVRVAT